MKTTPQERIAFALIALGLLISGYMDGQDAALAEKYSVTQQGQQVACIHCGGQP